jgi:hypothetical protein
MVILLVILVTETLVYDIYANGYGSVNAKHKQNYMHELSIKNLTFVTSTITTYYAFVVEFVGADHLCDLQEIVVDPRLMRYPEVDTPFFLFPFEFESICPTNLKSSNL